MTTPPRIYALIVAAGNGSRAGGAVPKQYARVGGKALLRYSCEALAARPAIAGVQVVIHPSHAAHYAAATQGLRLLPPVMGGDERADSVRAGLAALAPHAPDYVMIHDAARPFLSQAMIAALIIALAPDEAVLPALAVADTVRRFEGGTWHEVSRKSLMRMQTPQVFPFAQLRELCDGAHAARSLSPSMGVSPDVANARQAPSTNARTKESGGVHVSPTDEAAVWLAAGGQLRYVEGDESLRKVTTPTDIAWAHAYANSARRTAVGMGYDVHALMPSGSAGIIRLGGIDIAHAHKLHGHSDADVVLHAIVDALLGAIAAGDIGSFFPPSDARWKGANSQIFIEEARAQVAARGGDISHVDVTIICEAPKISPHREAVREAIAAMLQLPLARVSVKATTTETLGFTGREEGIACQAVATITLPAEAA
jgi:2-C-methyl-D-erythritol 4-phosphate cytidylyltransferase/2-C-methyl-D-erythritol 2,4-cyclodiphosphate synthase